MIDLMEIYLKVVGEEIENTATGIKNKDLKRIGDSAHRMKSNVRMMGLHDIMTMLDEIEINVREQKCSEDFYHEVQQVSNLLEKTLVKVKEQVDTAKATA